MPVDGPEDNCLCVFTRTPVPGRVKQRLAASLGQAAALRAHEELLLGTLDRCLGSPRYRSELWLTSLEPSAAVGRLRRPGLSLKLQQGVDLGARMQHTLEEGLVNGARRVLIGSDCPDIDEDYVSRAFAALDEFPVVLGPAEDGGYGLVGLSRPAPQLFSDMIWGDHLVLQRTLHRAEQAGLQVALLPEIYDVDLPEDWQRYRRTSSAPPPAKATE